MAKLALIFVIVSLFALCMAARIPREEPTTANPLQQILKNFQAELTPEKQEELKKKAEEILKQFVDGVNHLSNTVQESIRNVGEQKS